MKIFKWLCLGLILLAPPTAWATDANYQAKVEKIIEEKHIEVMGVEQKYQKLELVIVEGSRQGEKVVVENGNQPIANLAEYRVGNRVVISGEPQWQIVDFSRTDSLWLLMVIFVALTVFIAGKKGMWSVVSMMLTFWVIFSVILPQILAGNNPVLIAFLGSILIIPVSFYMSHGLNKKTSVAILGSIIALVLTSILAGFFINFGHLSGMSSEEAGMLSLGRGGTLNMKGILLASMVIGALGVLDDITISQAAIVDELSVTAKLKKFKDLYSRAMNIGKDHITSTVNTLVIAYAGAALPLMLIFKNNPHPFTDIINFEIIAEEIIRTLVGSIGLILAVPITTALAAWWYRRN